VAARIVRWKEVGTHWVGVETSDTSSGETAIAKLVELLDFVSSDLSAPDS
jgi:hypothetical protein